MAGWNGDLERWLAPFLARLGHKRARRRMCPLYVAGVIGPRPKERGADGGASGAGRLRPVASFPAVSGVWNEAPLEKELAIQAAKLIGALACAVLIVDDTALPKKGSHSVGVAPQYASALGKTANCQTLVSLTLARDEVPVMIGLRLFLPESWTDAADRMAKARVPEDWRAARTKPEIALAEIDRIRAADVRFALVLADAGYGLSAPFRQGSMRAASSGRSESRSCRKSTRATSGSCSRSPDAGGRVSAISPICFPRRLKTCSPRRSGDASAGAKEPKGSLWRPPRRRARADRRWSAPTHP